MSTVPPTPPPGPAPGPVAPKKYRPSAWWFGLGIAFLAVAVLAGVGLFVWTLSSFLDTQARIVADGRTHAVSVEPGEELMLWAEPGRGQECSVVDTETGQPVDRRSTGGRFERSDGDGDFGGLWRFDSGSGELEAACQGGGLVLVGAAPAFGSFVLGILLTIAVPGLLGLAGVAILIATGVLWSLRDPRPRGA